MEISIYKERIFRFIPRKQMYICACNDFKIPLHYNQRGTSSTHHWPTHSRETPDYRPGDNRRHVARGKRVFTGDKFKDSVSATRT